MTSRVGYRPTQPGGHQASVTYPLCLTMRVGYTSGYEPRRCVSACMFGHTHEVNLTCKCGSRPLFSCPCDSRQSLEKIPRSCDRLHTMVEPHVGDDISERARTTFVSCHPRMFFGTTFGSSLCVLCHFGTGDFFGYSLGFCPFCPSGGIIWGERLIWPGWFLG